MSHNKHSLIGLISVITLTVLVNLIPTQTFTAPVKAEENLAVKEVKPNIIIPDRMVAPVLEEEIVYTTDSVLSPTELKDVLYEAGFRGQSLKQAWGVAMKESTGKPMAHNQNSKTGDNSYGLFQINMIGSLGPARMELYNLNSYEELFDPLRNAQIAFEISKGGTNWSAWHGITDKTIFFMNQFPN